MDYSKYSKEQLIEIIDELSMLNKQLLNENYKPINLSLIGQAVWATGI